MENKTGKRALIFSSRRNWSVICAKIWITHLALAGYFPTASLSPSTHTHTYTHAHAHTQHPCRHMHPYQRLQSTPPIPVVLFLSFYLRVRNSFCLICCIERISGGLPRSQLCFQRGTLGTFRSISLLLWGDWEKQACRVWVSLGRHSVWIRI